MGMRGQLLIGKMQIIKISVNDNFVDISRLKDMVRIMTLDLPQGNTKKKNARLEFRFSCHCYHEDLRMVRQSLKKRS